MGYQEMARGALLDASPKCKTIEVDAGPHGLILVVLASPPEDFVLDLHEKMTSETAPMSNAEGMARLVIEMAHAPEEDESGEPKNFGTKRAPEYRPGKRLFADSDLKRLRSLPIGHWTERIREDAATFSKDLRTGGNSNAEVADIGTSALHMNSAESTNGTSKGGDRTA